MANLPVRLEERMRALLGEKYSASTVSYDKERVQGLRFNSLKFPDGRGDAAGSGKDGKDKGIWKDTGAAEAAGQVRRETGFAPGRIPWAKEGYYYPRDSRPGKYPHHEVGLHYVREPSAMTVVELLDPGPGECVSDLYAMLGRESGHIALRMKGIGFLLFSEIHPVRARIFSQNVERIGMRNAVVSNEGVQSLIGISGRFFHRIAVDVPCLGEGMFRKDEEARSQWSEEHAKMYTARQGEILDHVAATLAPGGRMVYFTCTFAPEENGGAVPALLRCHPEFYVKQMPAYPGFTRGKSQWVRPKAEGQGLEGALHIMPHTPEGEGHFIAVLRKEGDPESVVKTGRRGRLYLDSRKRKEAFRSYEPLIQDTLIEPGTFLEKRGYALFGEQLYLIPTDMSDMKGLKILRPGPHLGTSKENCFELSYVLALALRKEKAQCSWELFLFGDNVIRHLKGEALGKEAGISKGHSKGRVLACIGSFSLSWVKYVGDMFKNHYPKGLRRN